jgi:hypothetical protein
MSTHFLKTIGIAVCLLAIAGCPSTQQVKEEGPPPPRNLLGTTDELQLVTELLVNLVREHGRDPILVVLAIDNTLLATNGDSPCASGAGPRSDSLPPMVQPDTADLVKRMQDTGVRVIALSDDSAECGRSIAAELGHYGISFENSAWPSHGSPVAYQDGLVLTADQDKGAALKSLLEDSGLPLPGLIIMVDYRQQDLSEVMGAFAYSGTKVHAWRYTRVDTGLDSDTALN